MAGKRPALAIDDQSTLAYRSMGSRGDIELHLIKLPIALNAVAHVVGHADVVLRMGTSASQSNDVIEDKTFGVRPIDTGVDFTEA
jgi:hypothetical protein